jgi:hypothetical protein
VQPKHQRIESYFEQNLKEFDYIDQNPMTEVRNTKRSLTLKKSGSSVKHKTTVSKDDHTSNLTRQVQVFETYGHKASTNEQVVASNGGDTNRTRDNQRIDSMIQARKK